MSITNRKLSLEFSLRQAAPAMWEKLPKSIQEIVNEWIDSESVPTVTRVAPFTEGAFVKPRFHVRAMYRCVDGSTFNDGVIALKGTEIAANDLRDALTTMTAGRAYVNRIELFMYQEYKLPIAVRLREALLDARKALELNLAMWKEFGEQAALPVPLAVYRWPKEQQNAYEGEVHRVLSDTGLEVAEQLFDDLGVIVYYFPHSPIRVRHLRHETSIPHPSPVGRQERVRSWIELAARMMAAGYFPCTLDNQRQGCCLSDQNVCVDGGFVDIDSIKAMESIADPQLFNGNLFLTIAMLAHSCAVYLSGENTVASHPTFEEVITMHSIFGDNLAGSIYLPTVATELVSALESLRANGHQLDRRLEHFVNQGFGAETLIELTAASSESNASEMVFHTSVKHPFEAN